MVYSHDWNEEQVNELKARIRDERLSRKGSIIYECYKCGLGYTSSNGLEAHIAKCRKRRIATEKDESSTKTTTPKPPKRVGKDKHYVWSMEGGRTGQPKQLSTRPPTMPPLPDQMAESEKGSVLCPVPRCQGRFSNHDSLAYHCMIEHSELGAAGTPQDFSIRQYRFEDKEEYKEWLYQRSEETCTSFSTKTSMWSGYAMYRCNRAGIFKTSGTIRAGTTTKKAQSHCSAFLRISEYSDGSLDVTCCFGHIFHELDPTALRLNERQCGVLRKLLEERKFISDICTQMRTEYPPTNRLHYTSTNDIRNLALRLGLPILIKDRKQPSRAAPTRTRAGKKAPCSPEDGENSPEDEEATPEEQIDQEDNISSAEISDQEDPISADEASQNSEDEVVHSDMEQEDEDEDEDGLAIENPHEDEDDYSEDDGLRIDVDQASISVCRR
ncbi:zinc finger, C2H2 type [Ancylostoma duodenale]|uniref:Zinc finger, C2H2 type n=1 Tax=Ancylostoma duodenale TaxID=51022 RepID=A0A0C2DB84_9BILA|nr:zinc finger, C2H2 type [Ancylostoma duodenale]